MSEQNNKKIDQVLENLDLLNRVDCMEKSISSFNERITSVEDKIESLELKISEIENKKATTEDLRNQETQINDTINEL